MIGYNQMTAENNDPLAEVRAFLREAQAAAPGKRRGTLKETITALLPDLIGLRERGFSDAEIVDLLAKKGIKTTAGTLRQYLSELRAQQGGGGEKRPKKGTAKRDAAPSGSAGETLRKEEASKGSAGGKPSLGFENKFEDE